MKFRPYIDLHKGNVKQIVGSTLSDDNPEALSAWPSGLQIGGGINADNARYWLDQGPAAIIVTSCVFREGAINEERLKALEGFVSKDRLVLDLSCRRKGGDYHVVIDRWQRFTDVIISPELRWWTLTVRPLEKPSFVRWLCCSSVKNFHVRPQ